MDIREYARKMVENTGNLDLDREHYMKMLPDDKRQELVENIDGKLDILKKRMLEKDITLYQDHNLWYRAIKEVINVRRKVKDAHF